MSSLFSRSSTCVHVQMTFCDRRTQSFGHMQSCTQSCTHSPCLPQKQNYRRNVCVPVHHISLRRRSLAVLSHPQKTLVPSASRRICGLSRRGSWPLSPHACHTRSHVARGWYKTVATIFARGVRWAVRPTGGREGTHFILYPSKDALNVTLKL